MEAFNSKIPLRNLLLFRFFLRVLAAESLHAASRVQQLLFAGKEGMAIGADFYVNIALMGGAGGETMSTRALHPYFVVCGMNGCLHGSPNLTSNH
jgi:hypothetical protein